MTASLRIGIFIALGVLSAVEVMCRRNVGISDSDLQGNTTHEFHWQPVAFSFAQLRMHSWYHKGTKANEGKLARHAGCPAKASLAASQASGTRKAKSRYIFFERDRAGFNNIKLQLESLVAIAAITGRTLVLPNPGQNDHSSKQYFEFDFFDATNLTNTINMQLHKKPGKDVFTVPKDLNEVDIRKLDKDHDWFFTEGRSRIQHFECLSLNKHDRAIAAHAVLHGVNFDRHFEELATASLAKLGLRSYEPNFDCVHVRRGDFKSFASNYYMPDASLSWKLKKQLSGKRPVLVVSDEKPVLNLNSKVLYASDAYPAGAIDQTKVALDMIMCSRAKEFIGSPLSTFTNGIEELRRKNAWLEGAKPPSTWFFVGEPSFNESAGTCWNKQTTYEGIRSCEKGAPACFSSCTDQM